MFIFCVTGVPEDAIKSALPSVKACLVCTWHIMAIDFPTNLKHIKDYEQCKAYVYNNLVNNTVNKKEWEGHLIHACKTWPQAADYLQTLAVSKHRWGNPWRMEHFTHGMQASSVVEGSFSAFQRGLNAIPRSFVGVIQAHVRKDRSKTIEETSRVVNEQIRLCDPSVSAARNDAANACAKVMSSHVTDQFEEINRDAQDYTFEPIEVTTSMSARGVTRAWSVSRRENPSAKARVVEEMNGTLRCGCLEDINRGIPCRHIQSITGGAFIAVQFHCHHHRIEDVEICPVAPRIEECDFGGDCSGVESIDDDKKPSAKIDDPDKPAGQVDPYENHQGVFVQEWAQYTGIPPSTINNSTSCPTASKAPLLPRATKKKKPMTSNKMYNNILEEGKAIASIASQQSELYEKIYPLLRWLKTNIQNKDGVELKAAASDFVGIAIDKGGDVQLKPSVKKRTAGAMAVKRKRSSVEVATTSSSKTRPCTLCNLGGHNRQNCTKSKAIGTRLTKEKYEDKMKLLKRLVDEVSHCDRQDVIPKSILGLQVLGRVELGTTDLCKCHVVEKGCTLRNSEPSWFSSELISSWSGNGTSPSHNVWIKE